MKWIYAWVLTLVFFVAGASWARAQLTAEPAAVDLGRQAQDKTVEAAVTLINAGAEPVQIIEVRADCSCTAGTPAKRELAPGERTVLAVKLETRSYLGELTRRVTVLTSKGELVLPVKVTVLAYDNWAPDRAMLTLPPSRRGEEVSGDAALTYLKEGDAEITGFEPGQPWLAAEVVRREGKRHALKVTKKAGAPAGNHLTQLGVLTSDAVNPRVEFKVYAAVTSAVRVKPSLLAMPPGVVGEESRLKGELLGWDGSVPPRFEIKDGTVTVLGTGEEGLLFELAITPRSVGPATQLLRVYAGNALELEVPVIFRVRAVKQP
jgi:hypothetical protein